MCILCILERCTYVGYAYLSVFLMLPPCNQDTLCMGESVIRRLTIIPCHTLMQIESSSKLQYPLNLSLYNLGFGGFRLTLYGMYIRTFVCGNVHLLYMYTKDTDTHIHTNTHTHTHVHTHARTHARTHACTHAHTHTHTQREREREYIRMYILCNRYIRTFINALQEHFSQYV